MWASFFTSSFLFSSLLGTFKLPLIELETILPGKDFTLTARCFSTIIEVRTQKTPRSFDHSELRSCAALFFSCVQFCDLLSLIWKLWWIYDYVLTLMIIAVPLKMEEADFCAVQHHNSFFQNTAILFLAPATPLQPLSNLGRIFILSLWFCCSGKDCWGNFSWK